MRTVAEKPERQIAIMAQNAKEPLGPTLALQFSVHPAAMAGAVLTAAAVDVVDGEELRSIFFAASADAPIGRQGVEFQLPPCALIASAILLTIFSSVIAPQRLQSLVLWTMVAAMCVLAPTGLAVPVRGEAFRYVGTLATMAVVFLTLAFAHSTKIPHGVR